METTHRVTIATTAMGAQKADLVAANTNFRNKGYRGFKLTVNFKSGTGSVTPSFSEYDDSGNAIKTWSTSAITGAGVTTLEVYPALTTSGNVYNDVIGALYNAKLAITSTNGVVIDAVLDMIP